MAYLTGEHLNMIEHLEDLTVVASLIDETIKQHFLNTSKQKLPHSFSSVLGF